MDFEQFSHLHSLHTLSHRALSHILIPGWIRDGCKDLDPEIESSAYGETPPLVWDRVLELFHCREPDRLLDLGAGAGNLVFQTRQKGIKSWGIERNPFLIKAGHRLLDHNALPASILIEGDFLESEWPAVNKVFAATARFSQKSRRLLARRIEQNPRLDHFICVGRPVVLAAPWILEQQENVGIRWNLQESEIEETLFSWRREIDVGPSPRTETRSAR